MKKSSSSSSDTIASATEPVVVKVGYSFSVEAV